MILGKLHNLSVFPLLSSVFLGKLPNLSVLPYLSCVILGQLPDHSVLPLLSSEILVKFPYLCVLLYLSCIPFSTVTQLHLTLCVPMDCSTPGFPVHCQLPELAYTHVHQASDAIQPSHPMSSPSLPAFKVSQHQVLFQ